MRRRRYHVRNKSRVRIINDSNSAAGWATENPVLELGKVGAELDTPRIKVGDGVNPWNSLPYVQSEQLTADDLVPVGDRGLLSASEKENLDKLVDGEIWEEEYIDEASGKIGYSSNKGAWKILHRVEHINFTFAYMKYATVENNVSYDNIVDAWANRNILTYEQVGT